MIPGWEYGAILAGGVVIGVVGAMLGIGGGSLMVPYLTMAFGIPIVHAIAASIVAVIATSSAAAAVYLGNRITNLRLGITLETGTTVGGMLGGLTAISIGHQLLTLIFAISLFGTAAAMSRKQEEEPPIAQQASVGELGGYFYDPSLQRQVRYRVSRVPLGLGLSLLAGFISGLLGIGGGVVKVPTMVLGMRVPVKAATATSNFMIGVTAVASAFIYFSHGFVEAPITSAVAIGVFLGSLIGARLAPRVRSVVLTRAFSLLLGAVGILMVLRALGLS